MNPFFSSSSERLQNNVPGCVPNGKQFLFPHSKKKNNNKQKCTICPRIKETTCLCSSRKRHICWGGPGNHAKKKERIVWSPCATSASISSSSSSSSSSHEFNRTLLPLDSFCLRQTRQVNGMTRSLLLLFMSFFVIKKPCERLIQTLFQLYLKRSLDRSLFLFP